MSRTISDKTLVDGRAKLSHSFIPGWTPKRFMLSTYLKTHVSHGVNKFIDGGHSFDFSSNGWTTAYCCSICRTSLENLRRTNIGSWKISMVLNSIFNSYWIGFKSYSQQLLNEICYIDTLKKLWRFHVTIYNWFCMAPRDMKLILLAWT